MEQCGWDIGWIKKVLIIGVAMENFEAHTTVQVVLCNVDEVSC
jgi:hypothetical protein